jgi:hypothetical protein
VNAQSLKSCKRNSSNRLIVSQSYTNQFLQKIPDKRVTISAALSRRFSVLTRTALVPILARAVKGKTTVRW